MHSPASLCQTNPKADVLKGVSTQEHGAKCGSFFKDRDYGAGARAVVP
jgi:hypothetical protein